MVLISINLFAINYPWSTCTIEVDHGFSLLLENPLLYQSITQAGFSGMTVTGKYAGSYPFMPREQVTNFKYVKPVSDVWLIAATFYYVLTGELPRDIRKGQDPLEAILLGIIIPIRDRNKKLSKELAKIIDRALANNPKDRYKDAGEMKRALENV